MPILLSALLLTVAAAQADDPQGDLLHSDLPLWSAEGEESWPNHFFGEDGSFGCRSRLRFGDWKYQPADAAFDPHWYRITNWGAFHCYMMVRDAEDREQLDGRAADPSFLIQLGTARGRNGEVELWLLQRGARPGSSYSLFARRPSSQAITELDVLQRACPSGHVRDSGGLDTLDTRYCAINSRREMIRLARRMALLPPLGRLTLESPPNSE